MITKDKLKAFVLSSDVVLVAIQTDLMNGVITKEQYDKDFAYFAGRRRAYADMLALLDNANITKSNEG